MKTHITESELREMQAVMESDTFQAGLQHMPAACFGGEFAVETMLDGVQDMFERDSLFPAGLDFPVPTEEELAAVDARIEARLRAEKGQA